MAKEDKLDRNDMPWSIASETEVVCPECITHFPITPEVWGQPAVCSECETEFLIKAPPDDRNETD